VFGYDILNNQVQIRTTAGIIPSACGRWSLSGKPGSDIFSGRYPARELPKICNIAGFYRSINELPFNVNIK
jgi:hypothetical protein